MPHKFINQKPNNSKKTKKNQRNQKNQSPGGNPWAQHFSQDFGFFGILRVFLFFSQPCSRWTLPSLKTKKTRGKPKKPKKPKKPIPWRKPLGTTFLPRLCFFWFLWFFWFSSSFFCFFLQPCSRWKLPSLKTKKTRGKPKKPKKPKKPIPWRKPLGTTFLPRLCFFWFLCFFLGFFEFFDSFLSPVADENFRV